MSNDVGALYQTVIEGVIREARLDFEDMGESESTLLELQKEWQSRLSAMNVASFMPWDAADEKSLVGSQPMFYGYDIGMPVLSGANSDGTSVAGRSLAPPTSLDGIDTSKLGSQGTYLKEEETYPGVAVPGGVVQGAGSPHLANGVRGLEVPGQGLSMPQLPQTDGIVSEQDLRAAIQDIMNSKDAQTKVKAQQSRQSLPQNDGPADETVGSDLDDSEDELNSENEDDDAEQGMIMLCLYDKVQRVKNKWKYVLKDGVANINGADYVFSRATGESEW